MTQNVLCYYVRYDAKGALAALGDYSNGMHIQVENRVKQKQFFT